MQGDREISLVIPTLNEADNIGQLLLRLDLVLTGRKAELLVCDDDSPDGTADVAEAIARRVSCDIRVIRRSAPHGLGHAILDGFSRARGQILGVIDADFQHDEVALPTMLERARTRDLAIGSRYEFMGGISGWSKWRELESRLAAGLTRKALGTAVRDPLSGYFLMRRGLYEQIVHRMQPQGWKVLLEIIGHAPGATFAEVPFIFRSRAAGESKMSWRVAQAWLSQLRRLAALNRSPVDTSGSMARGPKTSSLPVLIPRKAGAR